MKQVIATVVFVFAIVVVKAQSEVTPPHAFNYRQKRFLDSLRNIHKQPVVIINPQPWLVYNMPVSQLKNDGEKTGLTGEDTIYRMKTDNMLLLKPDISTMAIPNSADDKLFTLPPAKKKP